jgi:hypothetical protein
MACHFAERIKHSGVRIKVVLSVRSGSRHCSKEKPNENASQFYAMSLWIYIGYNGMTVKKWWLE